MTTPPSDAHHVICGRYGNLKAPDALTIPLCKGHHQDGPLAIHNGKESWVERYGPDTDYLAVTDDWLASHTLAALRKISHPAVQSTEAMNRWAEAMNAARCPTCKDGDAPPDIIKDGWWKCPTCRRTYREMGDE